MAQAPFLYNAKFSRVSRGGRLHDKIGGTTIHANGHRVKRRAATYCYVYDYIECYVHSNVVRTTRSCGS